MSIYYTMYFDIFQGVNADFLHKFPGVVFPGRSLEELFEAWSAQGGKKPLSTRVFHKFQNSKSGKKTGGFLI